MVRESSLECHSFPVYGNTTLDQCKEYCSFSSTIEGWAYHTSNSSCMLFEGDCPEPDGQGWQWEGYCWDGREAIYAHWFNTY